MRLHLAAACAATLLTAGTAPAFAEAPAILNVTFNVPVRCEAAAVGASVSEGQLTISVKRTCNTSHAVTIAGGDVEGLGDVTITESRTGRTLSGTQAVFGQAEAYYSGTDQFVIRASHSSPEALLKYGQSLTVGVEVT